MAPHRALGRVILGPGWGCRCGLAVTAALIHMVGTLLTHSRAWFKVECVETQHGILPAMALPHAHGTATAADLVGLEHHEVLGGEVVEKAAPSFEHGDAQGTIYGRLLGFRGPGRPGHPGGWWLGTEVDIELARHEVYLPDIVGWRIARVPERPRGRPVRVAPDWACEVLSPSTAARDLGHKQRTYHRARIGHYWVVEPANDTLTVYRWQEDGYLLAMVAGAGEVVRVEPFDAIELDIGDIFGLPPKER